jgi:hypothetical protein
MYDTKVRFIKEEPEIMTFASIEKIIVKKFEKFKNMYTCMCIRVYVQLYIRQWHILYV